MSLCLCALTLLLLVSGCAHVRESPAPAIAATAPVIAATAPAPDLVARDLERYLVLFKRGRYDELLADINGKIAALPADKRAHPDRRLLYVRGVTYHKLGWFKEAKTDLLIAQKEGDKIYHSKSWLDDIKRKEAVLPPNVREIRDGERVLFRMHSFGAKGDAATVAELLPDAYRINRQIFGADVEATTILVFDNYDQFSAFRREHTGKSLLSWPLAVTTGPLVQISLRDKKGFSNARDNRLDLHRSLAHEVNHAMMNRLMGKAPLPSWFKEGLAQVAEAQVAEAQVAEAQVAPDFDAGKQKRIAYLFQKDGGLLLPMEKLNKNASFKKQVDLRIAMRKRNHYAGAPDPYSQSYGMVKYLLVNSSTAQLQSLLRRVRASDDFDGSFAAEFGLTTEQFYQRWKAATERRLFARSLKIFNFPVEESRALPLLPKSYWQRRQFQVSGGADASSPARKSRQ